MAPTTSSSAPTLPHQEDVYDSEIPPAIACARCGQVHCDGCTPRIESASETNRVQETGSRLLWERETNERYLRRLILTALMTADADQACFKSKTNSSFWSGLHFAIAAETLAIVSFGIPWALGFTLLFPSLALEMVRSPEVLLMACSVFSVLVGFVVILHLVWGTALEWAIRWMGQVPNYAQGNRFGLYACGWDLLASPAGALLLLRLGGTKAVLRGLGAARRAPRLALSAYLHEGREVDPRVHRRVVFITFLLVSVFFLAVLFALFTYILWRILY